MARLAKITPGNAYYTKLKQDLDNEYAPQRRGSKEREPDIVVVGAGILGTRIAFLLGDLFDCSVTLVDMAERSRFIRAQVIQV